MIEISEKKMKLQLYFYEPTEISQISGEPDQLIAHVKLDGFLTVDGEELQPSKMTFVYDLPTQIGYEDVQMIDGASQNLSFVLYILMGVSFGLNSLFMGLSYMSAFDALDGIQILGFTPLLAVNYPVNANVFIGNLIDTGGPNTMESWFNTAFGLDTILQEMPDK